MNLNARRVLQPAPVPARFLSYACGVYHSVRSRDTCLEARDLSAILRCMAQAQGRCKEPSFLAGPTLAATKTRRSASGHEKDEGML